MHVQNCLILLLIHLIRMKLLFLTLLDHQLTINEYIQWNMNIYNTSGEDFKFGVYNFTNIKFILVIF